MAAHSCSLTLDYLFMCVHGVESWRHSYLSGLQVQDWLFINMEIIFSNFKCLEFFPLRCEEKEVEGNICFDISENGH